MSSHMQEYSPKKFVALLIQKGWYLDHKKSTHFTYAHPKSNKIITIPVARKEISRPLAKRLLKEMEIF